MDGANGRNRNPRRTIGDIEVKIKESDYILIKNLAKVEMAQKAVSDVLPDSDGVITKEELRKVTSILAKWIDAAYKKIDTVEDK